jgi:hypothetical protein
MRPSEEEKGMRDMRGRTLIDGRNRCAHTGMAGLSAGLPGRRRVWSVGVLCVGCALMLMGVPACAPAAEAPKVEEQWAAHVSATAATLAAKVNPGEASTTYEFEYSTSEAALLAGEGEVFPAPPSEGEVGAGSEGVVVEAHPQDLTAHTNYWYRVIAKNGEGATPGCQVPGSCQALTTQPVGEGVGLPDGRMWELVSPPVKDGALIAAIGEGGGLVQASDAGNAITYVSVGPAKSGQEEPSGNASGTQVLSTRDVGGWSSQDIATPHEVSTGQPINSGEEYRFFSPNLSVGLVEPLGSGELGGAPEGAAPLSPCASEKTLYERDDMPLTPEVSEQGIYGEALAEGGYKPVVTSKPGCADVPENTVFGGEARFVDATPNLTHVILFSYAPLLAGTERGELYEWTAGRSPNTQLQAVSVLPNDKQAQDANLGENQGLNVRGAVSADGSRIIWSYDDHLFMRDVSSEPEQTVQLDEGPGPGEAVFQFATNDGSKVFFTDGERLTAGSKAESGKPDLYECEMVEDAGELKCVLSDLTEDQSEGAGVQKEVLAGSGDGSYLYFVATGKLTGTGNGREEAKVGADNLYMLHYDEEARKWEAPTFITILSSEDMRGWGDESSLEGVTSRVSPDGEYLAFMSERSLTGYDNRDVNSGEPDQEVYLYRAPSVGAPSGRLVCVSCNPTGERPAGVFDSPEARNGDRLLVDQQGDWLDHWLAGSVPGWTAMSLGRARYQSRYLSDSGRVFFDSPDGLVPQATNGLEDVYEYEPVGVGGEDGCEMSSSGFSERSDGCVGLVSSGSSGEESVFLDASESGDDVFFLSSAQLVAADKDTAFDVYDAHACSVAEPCFTEALTPPPCTTVDSCRVAPTPQPVIFGEPSSATFSGPGNVASPPPVSVVKAKVKSLKCKKGFVKKKGKCVRKSEKGSKARKASDDRRVKS